MTNNYFAWFDLPQALNIDTAALRKPFLALSRRYHPDFSTSENAAEQDRVLQLSTYNNEAYQTLLDPDLRLRYLLELNGYLAAEGKQQLPQSFLMEMMDINEALMDLEMEYDATAFANLKIEIEAIDNQLDSSVENLKNTFTAAIATTADWEILNIFYLKKKYLLRIKKKLLTFASQ